MPTILRQNNPKAERFQQLLALAGLAQQQEQGQNQLQQQMAFHQAGLQQQQAEAQQMATWRQMQSDQAGKQEADRSGEFWGGTLPAEYARMDEATKQRQDTGALTVADSLFRLGKDEQGRQMLPDYLQPKVQQLHENEVAAEVGRYGPILTAPGMTPEMQGVLMSSIGPKVHPDVLNRLQGMIAPKPVVAPVAPVATAPIPTSIPQEQTPLMDINSREGIRRNPGAEALLRFWKTMTSTPPSPALSKLDVSPQDFGYPN